MEDGNSPVAAADSNNGGSPQLQSPIVSQPLAAPKRPSARTLLLAVSLLCAATIQTAAGTVYLFGLYGPQLSDKMEWSQKQTALVAGCLSWGISLSGPLLGKLVDKRATTPWPIFLAGGASIATGYGLISATYTGHLPWRHFAIVSLYFLLVGAGSAACYHCSLATNIRNWPAAHRGVAVGVPVSMFGLSAFIYARVADRFFYTTKTDRQLDMPGFLVLLAAGGVMASLLAATFLRDYREEAPELSVGEQPTDEDDNDARVVEEEHRPLLQRLDSRRVRFDDDGESDIRGENRPDERAHVPLWKRAEMYLLTASYCTLVGVGLMYSAGIGTLVVGLSPADATPASPVVQRAQNLHVTLFSLSSFSGRMLAGLLSDRAARSPLLRIPRIAWTSLASILMAIASGLMVVAISDPSDDSDDDNVDSLNFLRVVTVLIGGAYGVVWMSTPTVLVDLVGGDVFATCWGWVTLSAAFAAQALMVVFGSVYDAGREVLGDGDWHSRPKWNPHHRHLHEHGTPSAPPSPPETGGMTAGFVYEFGAELENEAGESRTRIKCTGGPARETVATAALGVK
ncbi:hypothetical protein HDU89_005663 [Geranomyces variabilis]|nr:hypothetical protein HDU89_005663 [Geranomyces variabilis]